MSTRSLVLLLVVGVVLLFGSSFVYTVKEYERGILLNRPGVGPEERFTCS